MYSKLPFDTDRDFAAVSLLAIVPSIFVVHESVPAKTPKAVVDRLAQEAARAAKSPSVAERFAADDAEAVGSTPAEYAAFIRKEQERWSKVVRAANIKAD
jgi:tripartite-type tricarboxylate transporter receptor subunit TctC